MPVKKIAITFHGIGSPTRQLETGECRYWISRDQFLAFLDQVAALPEPGRVHLTFDDGNASDHDIALPALAERGLHGAFFVLSGRVGQAGSLSPEQVRALADAGMTIGNHGARHLDWRQIGAAELESELHGARDRIAELSGQPVTTVALPFGRYDPRVLAALRNAGYARVYTTDGGSFAPDAWLAGRSNARADTSPAAFAQLISGRETPAGLLRRIAKRIRRRFV